MTQGAGFAGVLRVGEFRALLAAELLSVLGDQLARVALAVLVFQRTSSAALAALTYALTFVPAVLGGVLLSGLADRYRRKHVLVVTDLARACLAGAMAIPSMPLPAMWVLVGVLSVASAPFKAAQLALLPQVLTGQAYVSGLSLRQITGQATQLAGFASGGLLLTAVEPHVILGINAATFLMSTVLIAAGVRPRPAPSPDASSVDRRGPAPPARRSQLPPLIALTCLIGLFVVPEGLAAPYGASLGAGSPGVGLLMAADPLGSVLGAWLIARSRIRVRPATTVALAAASGLPLVACAPGPGLALSLALWALSGALSTAYLIQNQALVVELVPDHHRGRVMGWIATCLYSSQGVAIVLGGVAAQLWGAFRAVAIAGLLGVALSLCVGIWWRNARSRREHATGSEPEIGSRNFGQMSLLNTAITPSTRPGQMGRPARKRRPNQMSLFATVITSSQAEAGDDTVAGNFPGGGIRSRNRRQGTSGHSLWGCPSWTLVAMRSGGE